LIAALQKAKAGEAGGPISPAIAEASLKPQFDEWQGMGFQLDGEGQARSFYHYGETLDILPALAQAPRMDAAVSS
jgi:hypothetical protein